MTTDEDEVNVPPGPSPLAQEIAKLKAACFKAAETRERIPQPLFWSLFQQKVNELKEGKSLERLIKELGL